MQWVSEWMSAQALGTLGLWNWNQSPEGLGDVTSMAWISRGIYFPMGASKILIWVPLLLSGPCVLLDIFQILWKRLLQKVPKSHLLTGHLENQWADPCTTSNKNKEKTPQNPKKPNRTKPNPPIMIFFFF